MEKRGLASLVDEAAHAGPVHLDAEFVAGYDRKQQIGLRPDLELLREYGLTERSALVVLDAGTGRFPGGSAWPGSPHETSV